MKRNLSQMENTRFDLLIIGGGIYGATVAWEGARRGLAVGLIDKNDFGGATSANSLKVIHGGIRYLQHGDIIRMRRSIRARRKLLRLMHNWVTPMAFVVPTVSRSFQSRAIMELALCANNIIAWDRNKGVHRANRIPRGHSISKRKCLELIPGLELRNLDGGAVWYDGFAHNTERLNLEFIITAADQGAMAVNYVKAIDYVFSGKRIRGVILEDRLTGQTFEAQARIVVDARGPWMDHELGDRPESSNGRQGWAKAVNLILRKPLFGDFAVGLPGQRGFSDKDAIVNRGSRFFFCVPWRGGTIVGTHYQYYEGSPNECRLKRADAEILLNEINGTYPPANLNFDDIAFYHLGLVPIISNVSDRQHVILEKHTTIYDYEKLKGIEGLIGIKGVKYTTATETAGSVVDLVMQKLGRRRKPYAAHRQLVPGAETISASTAHVTDNGPAKGFKHLSRLKSVYGQNAYLIMQLIQHNQSLLEELDSSIPCIKAEIINAVRNEMACTIDDVLMRRTSLASLGHPGKSVIAQIADLMAGELKWSETEKDRQITSSHATFRMPL